MMMTEPTFRYFLDLVEMTIGDEPNPNVTYADDVKETLQSLKDNAYHFCTCENNGDYCDYCQRIHDADLVVNPKIPLSTP